jgi:hypothetical protein
MYNFQVEINLPDSSKDLHVPSLDNIPNFWNCRDVVGFKHKLDPPTMAASQRPLLILCKA